MIGTIPSAKPPTKKRNHFSVFFLGMGGLFVHSNLVLRVLAQVMNNKNMVIMPKQTF